MARWGGLALAWLLGFVASMVVMKDKVMAAAIGFLFGPFIGSIILLPALWILVLLSIVLGYGLAFIGWSSGLIVILDVLREWTKFPKEWREGRERIDGSTQPGVPESRFHTLGGMSGKRPRAARRTGDPSA
jgi:hypothetical protein